MTDPIASPYIRSSRHDATELIEQVRLRPCLWDRSCRAYRSRSRLVREQAWRDVCRALHPPYDAMSSADKHEMGILIMRKWYNIRDAYRKSYASKMNSGPSTRSYVYSDQLSFLVPIFEGKGNDESVKDESIKFEPVEEEDHEQEREEWLNVLEIDATEPTTPKRSKLEVEYPRLKETTESQDDSFLSVLVNLIEKEEDEDRAFFKSITPAVKSLSDEMKFVFRIQVMKLLNNMTKKRKDAKSDRISDRSDTE